MDWYHPSLGLLSASSGFVLAETQYPGGWLRQASDAERTALGFIPTRWGARPDDKLFFVADTTGTLENGVYVVRWNSQMRSIEDIKKLRLADLAAKRYQVEVGGCLLNGQPATTDRDTQAKVNGAFVAVANGLPAPLVWKTPNGFVTLDEITLKAIALGIASHVQAAFANEAAHAAAIEALTDTDAVIAHDISTGWPANPVTAGA